MDGLEEFEKQLAADRAEREQEREREERKHRKHHHRDRSSDRQRDRDTDRHVEDRHRHHHSKRRDGDEDGHRHKRSKHSRDDDERRHRHRHQAHERKDKPDSSSTDPKEKLPLPDEEATPIREKSDNLVRDSWMTAPSAIDIDYVHRPDNHPKPPPPKEEPKRIIHKRELNASHLKDLNSGQSGESASGPAARVVDYKFGDDGSQWRMTKLRAVYAAAKETGRSVDEIALERYGSLEDFDDAREENIEMERRKVYGSGFVGKEKPTGELHRERVSKSGKSGAQEDHESESDLEQGVVIPEPKPTGPTVTQTELNRLKAELMRAKLRRAPNAAQLEAEYNEAMASFSQNGPQTAVVGVMDNRMLAGTRGEARQVETKRGQERGQLEQNEDMTIEDMIREERRTRGQVGGEGMRLAERIAKDAKFDDDLEYLDENADRLAKRVHKSEVNLRNVAINEYQKMQRILDHCPLCHHEDKGQPPLAPIVSLGTRVFLTLPTEPEISDGGACIVPIAHHQNLLECDDDEWEEVRNFMKSLTRMYHDQGREVLFYENAATPHRHLHAAMMVVAIPYEDGDTAPAYFKEAFLSADEEWAQHKKIIDTGAKARNGSGKLAFRRSIAKEMPYFHVWFNLDGGLGHIVEDSERWPKGDLFAREVIGGIVDAGPEVIKKQGRWKREDRRLEGFKKRWRKFDWTRVLTEG